MQNPGSLPTQFHCRLAGDSGLLVELGESIDPKINRLVRTMAKAIEKETPLGIIEVIPTYRSLLLVYDPQLTSPKQLIENLVMVEKKLSEIHIPPPELVEIPVCYGGEFGPDISFVAKSHGLTEDEVIKIHTEPKYPIYMIGFTPGFPFLGGLPEVLHTPRLETPRSHVPKGSVGIANAQTGIYPVASPGGWQIIGQTPLQLFSPSKVNPFLYQTGDIIKFKSITRHQFDQIAGEIK